MHSDYFVQGILCGVIITAAAWAMVFICSNPAWTYNDVIECRQNQVWCMKQKPALYEALTK